MCPARRRRLILHPEKSQLVECGKRSLGHAECSGVEIEVGEAILRHPAELFGFVVPGHNSASRGEHQEPYVEMQVGVLRRWIDTVDVDIDGGDNHPEALDSGFFGGFTPRHVSKIHVAVGMTAGLQPSLQFRVEQQQHRPRIDLNHKRRAGEVTGATRPHRYVLMILDEVENAGLFEVMGTDRSATNLRASDGDIVGGAEGCVGRLDDVKAAHEAIVVSRRC